MAAFWGRCGIEKYIWWCIEMLRSGHIDIVTSVAFQLHVSMLEGVTPKSGA
jgi:hypothetical protein